MQPSFQSCSLSTIKASQNVNQSVQNSEQILQKIFKEIYFEIDLPISQANISLMLGKYNDIKQQQFVLKFQQAFFKGNMRETNIKFYGKNCFEIIRRLAKYGVPKKFISFYMKLGQIYYQSLVDYFHRQQLQQFARRIPLLFLPNLLKFFRFKLKEDLALCFISQLLDQRIKKAVNQIIFQSQNPGRAINYALQYIRNNFQGKQSKQYQNSIFQLASKLKKTAFPQLQMQLQRKSVMHFLKNGWQVFQQVCQQRPQLLVIGVEKLLNKKQTFEYGFSICHRNQRIINKLSFKNKRIIQKKIQEQILQPVLNKLAHNEFRPSSQQMLHIEQFGIKLQDIKMVNYNTPLDQIQAIMAHINEQKVIAIDTQSLLIRTKLSKQIDLLALIQVAVKGKVYLFDAFDIRKSAVTKKGFQRFLADKENKILGHALSNDIGVFKNILGIRQREKCQVIQIKSLFNQFKGNSRSPSLADLCQKVFNKKLCKQYTKTNWKRRPLLLNQIHYAAMDAYVVLQMFNRLSKQ